MSVNDLFQRIAALADSIEGITISGGEPLQQRWPLLALLRQIRQETALSAVLFTGYTRKEVSSMPDVQTLFDCVDILVAGRYDASQRLACDLRGSTNKTVHFLTDRYTIADVQSIPASEIIITPEGSVMLCGIDPVSW